MKVLKKHPHWKMVKKVCKKISDSGGTAWLAGGCVRDSLMGRKPKDFDIATDLTIEDLQKIFKKTIEFGKSFGVIRVVEGGLEFEVARFRSDGKYEDGRHPTSVEFTTPNLDAQRRDFTINALFFDPIKDEIHDFVEGKNDIKKRIIRAVGDPLKRFDEDKLRVLRAVRFVSQLGFSIDENTKNGLKEFTPQIKCVSWERIYQELDKMFSGENLFNSWQMFLELGLGKVILPEIEKRADWSIFKKLHNKELVWLEIMRETSPHLRNQLVRRLKMSNQMIKDLEEMVEVVDKIKIWKNLKLSEKRLISAMPKALVAYELALAHKMANSTVKTFILKNRKLPKAYVAAKDLLKVGFQPGPKLGQTLGQLYQQQLDKKLKNKAHAIKAAKLLI